MTEKQVSMREPQLIVEADEPAIFYSSVSRAESDLEPIDVLNDVYTAAFGPRGEQYLITTDGYNTTIVLDETVPPDPDRLKEVLLRFLDSVKVPADQTETLEELLAKCVRFVE